MRLNLNVGFRRVYVKEVFFGAKWSGVNTIKIKMYKCKITEKMTFLQLAWLFPDWENTH